MNYPSSVLTHVLGTDPSKLCSQSMGELYNSFVIRPRRGRRKARKILAPCDELKQVQRAILEKIIGQVSPHPSATAFFQDRSIGANARAHHLCAYLFKTDISDFFGSISVDIVRKMLSSRFPHLSSAAIDEIVVLTTLDGVLPQGAPTSPHLANLVLYDFDVRISRLCHRIGASYTRYADDLAVSAADNEALDIVVPVIRSELAELALTLHPQKTKRYGPGQRKIVTGLDVSSALVRPPRAYRKKAAALVRMSEVYPVRMERHFPRVKGYLAHWEGTCPEDQELLVLKTRMKRLMRGSASQRNYEISHPHDDQIPF